MTNEKDKSAGYDLAIDWTQSLSGDGIETDEIAHLGARIADLLATVRAEEREAAFKEAAQLLNEFGRELRKIDFLARLEAAAKATKYAELDRVLAEAAIADPIGVRLTELALERMDAEDERATENRKGEG